MLHQRSAASSGCAAILSPANDAVVLAACRAALKLRADMTLFGKPAAEGLAACLGNHFGQSDARNGTTPASFVAWLAEQHLAPHYVEGAPGTERSEAVEIFGATFSAAFLLVDLQEAA